MGKQIPFPGIVRDPGRGRWKIRELKANETPNVNLVKREMAVPMGDTPAERDSRLHEMGHATWTEPKLIVELAEEWGVHPNLIQAAEDARVNINLMNLGLPLESEALNAEALVRLNRAKAQDKLAMLLCTKATGDQPGVVEAVAVSEAQLVEMVDQLLEAAGYVEDDGVVNGQEVTRKLIEIIASMRGDSGSGGGSGGTGEGDGASGGEAQEGEKESDTGEPQEGEGEGSSFPELDYTNVEAKRPTFTGSGFRSMPRRRNAANTISGDTEVKLDTEAATSMMDALESIAETGDGIKPIQSHLLEGDGINVKHGRKRQESQPHFSGFWAPMGIVEPARPERVPARIRGKSKGVNDTGAIPVAMHRATSDGRVFRSPRIKPMAGAVLIDNSGSMGFKVEDLLEIMAALPAATIADYCASGTQGQLRILASKGRMVRREILSYSIGGGNGCDGLALRWLLQQRGPRFWVSDGGVSGKGDRALKGAGEECLVLCRAGKVIQFQSIRQLEQMLASGVLSLRRHPPLRDRDRPPYRILKEGGWIEC